MSAVIELSESQLRELIDDIRGTTKTIEDGLEGIGVDRDAILAQRTLDEIDEAVFTCEGCGWMLDVDERYTPDSDRDGEELDGDWCDDCGPDQMEK